MGQAETPSSSRDASSFKYIVGVDIGSQTCSMSVLRPDKSQVMKPADFANASAGFTLLLNKLEPLGVPPAQISHWSRGDLALWRESLPLSGKSRLPAVPLAP